jgi:1-acyl-sn-glycerol-3-phosphate acyltransferase
MSALRAGTRATGAVLVTLPSYLAALVGGALLGFWPKGRARWHGWVFQRWCRALCRIFGVRVRVTGRPPTPPFVLVSNHVSYLDILVLGTRLPCVFVAKAEIDDWPVFGALCRAVNTIFIDRKAKRALPKVMAEIETMLAAHQGVVIFAEGTSGPGHEVLPFRSSLLDLPARIGRPVHWAALGYGVPPQGVPVHLCVTWWGDMPLGGHLRELLRVPWIEAPVVFGAEPVAASDRKQMADALHRRVAGAFRPMVDKAEIERLLDLKQRDPAALPPVLRGSHESEF